MSNFTRLNQFQKYIIFKIVITQNIICKERFKNKYNKISFIKQKNIKIIFILYVRNISQYLYHFFFNV